MERKKHYHGIIYTGSFLEAICPILFASQVLGIFPLKRIRPRPSTNFYFTWFSYASVVCVVFIFWDLVVILSHILYTRNFKINADIISTTVFFGMGVLIYGVFMRLSMRWVEIANWWTEKEQRFLRPPYLTENSRKLKKKLITVAILIAFLATEHGLYQLSDIYLYTKVIGECNVTRGFQSFLVRRFEYVNNYIPGIISMILSQFVSWFATAAWNFLDLFIIVISIGISTRFDQLTVALENHLKHNIPDSKTMLRFRLDYITICEILEYVDNHMGLIVFLSAANNLFFVCKQLLHASNVLRYYTDYVYYWLSMMYLITRTFFMFFSAAGINDSARGPIVLLHNIPQEYWNEESSRLLFQINSSTIALTAMGFFSFTRRIILTMAGAIVTFELVMMQFVTPVNNLGPLCP
ncbi:gustatory receptor for sugar taste 64a-like isoform X2 [Eupeodes corollae]|uniref:gustatory receptor for sugar taste 64a-like isoform X2 n=1 Tax=Eupeodes corollae TaxID=290404 RepID=UPI002490249B|nr:gustatory receptor for sugar taste 64a-like isoform X2 [Eupeodes corollae]